MITPGWLPVRPRSALRRRTLPYTPLPRRRMRRIVPKAARPAITVDTEVMLFDHAAELPVATVRRAPTMRLTLWAGDLQRWLLARWQWLRPRTIPVLVAMAGMFAVLRAVDYLANPPAAQLSLSIDTAPEPPLMYIDGKPYRGDQQVPELSSTSYRVRLVVQQ